METDLHKRHYVINQYRNKNYSFCRWSTGNSWFRG